MNKKLRHQDGTSRKRTRRAVKIQKAIAGLSLEDIRSKHALKKAVPGAKAAALKEARARQAARQEKTGDKAKVPKVSVANLGLPLPGQKML